MIAISLVFDQIWLHSIINDLIAIRSWSRQALLVIPCITQHFTTHVGHWYYEYRETYTSMQTNCGPDDCILLWCMDCRCGCLIKIRGLKRIKITQSAHLCEPHGWWCSWLAHLVQCVDLTTAGVGGIGTASLHPLRPTPPAPRELQLSFHVALMAVFTEVESQTVD